MWYQPWRADTWHNTAQGDDSSPELTYTNYLRRNLRGFNVLCIITEDSSRSYWTSASSCPRRGNGAKSREHEWNKGIWFPHFPKVLSSAFPKWYSSLSLNQQRTYLHVPHAQWRGSTLTAFIPKASRCSVFSMPKVSLVPISPVSPAHRLALHAVTTRTPTVWISSTLMVFRSF